MIKLKIRALVEYCWASSIFMQFDLLNVQMRRFDLILSPYIFPIESNCTESINEKLVGLSKKYDRNFNLSSQFICCSNDTGLFGQAYVGQTNNRYSVSVIKSVNKTWDNQHVMGHEIFHNFNSSHILKCVNTYMDSCLGEVNLTLANKTLNEIRKYIKPLVNP